MKKKDKIFVAGHKGLVGSAMVEELDKQGFKNIYVSDKKRLNLLNSKEVMQYFKSKKFDVVFVCAAKVGGIFSNSTKPYEFLVENLTIQNNIFNACLNFKVKKVMYMGSSCIYPRHPKIPIKEEYLLTGKLEKTNEAYAIAKIAGLKAAESLILKYNMDIRCFMPCNLYGKNDRFFDTKNSHVLPALMHRIYEAKKNNLKEVVVWGDGSPKREFMFSEDLAKNIVKIMTVSKKRFLKNIGDNYFYNIGSNTEITIKSLCSKISNIIGYKGKLKFDKSKPNGTPRKYMSKSKIRKVIQLELTDTSLSLKKTYSYYLKDRNKTNI